MCASPQYFPATLLGTLLGANLAIHAISVAARLTVGLILAGARLAAARVALTLMLLALALALAALILVSVVILRTVRHLITPPLVVLQVPS